MLAEPLYRRLPIGLQSAACSAAGWLRTAGGQRGRRETLARAAFARLQLRPAELLAYRDGRLREFVAEAVRTVPYYDRLFRELGLSPADIAVLDDMRKLPILTPETLAQRAADFVASTARRADGTRQPLPGLAAAITLPWSREARWEREAVQLRFEREQGIAAGTWCAYFGGTNVVPLAQSRPPYWRIDWPGRRVIFSPYHLSEQTVESYADALNHFQCPWLRGSPAVLAALAGLMSVARLSIDYALPWITTNGERLFGIQRRALSRVFGVVPKRSFIDPLGAACITERSDGTLAIDEDYAAVELLPTTESGTYRVVGTNMSNPAAPLLRYDTGLTVRLGDQPIDAERQREVASLEGWSQDLVTLPSGARIGRLERIFDDLPQVRAARIVQHADLTIDVDVLMAPGHSVEDDQAVTERVAARFGAAACRVNHVDRMALVTSGKLQMVHSEAGGVNRGVVEPRSRWVSIE